MKVVVPPGMLKAARKTNGLDRDIALESRECDELRIRLEAAIHWLMDMISFDLGIAGSPWNRGFAAALQEVRAIFIAPEVTDGIDDLLWEETHPDTRYDLSADYLNRQIREAYSRGKNSR